MRNVNYKLIVFGLLMVFASQGQALQSLCKGQEALLTNTYRQLTSIGYSAHLGLSPVISYRTVIQIGLMGVHLQRELRHSPESAKKVIQNLHEAAELVNKMRTLGLGYSFSDTESNFTLAIQGDRRLLVETAAVQKACRGQTKVRNLTDYFPQLHAQTFDLASDLLNLQVQMAQLRDLLNKIDQLLDEPTKQSLIAAHTSLAAELANVEAAQRILNQAVAALTI